MAAGPPAGAARSRCTGAMPDRRRTLQARGRNRRGRARLLALAGEGPLGLVAEALALLGAELVRLVERDEDERIDALLVGVLVASMQKCIGFVSRSLRHREPLLAIELRAPLGVVLPIQCLQVVRCISSMERRSPWAFGAGVELHEAGDLDHARRAGAAGALDLVGGLARLGRRRGDLPVAIAHEAPLEAEAPRQRARDGARAERQRHGRRLREPHHEQRERREGHREADGDGGAQRPRAGGAGFRVEGANWCMIPRSRLYCEGDSKADNFSRSRPRSASKRRSPDRSRVSRGSLPRSNRSSRSRFFRSITRGLSCSSTTCGAAGRASEHRSPGRALGARCDGGQGGAFDGRGLRAADVEDGGRDVDRAHGMRITARRGAGEGDDEGDADRLFVELDAVPDGAVLAEPPLPASRGR